jgi:hypothetical protein
MERDNARGTADAAAATNGRKAAVTKKEEDVTDDAAAQHEGHVLFPKRQGLREVAPTVPTKKGRHVGNNTTDNLGSNSVTANDHFNNGLSIVNGVVGTLLRPMEFTFGTLPPISDQDSQATVLISKRSVLQKLFQEGNEIFSIMLGLNISVQILDAMYKEIGSGKSVSSTSTYVDGPKNHHHRFYLVAVPDSVSRCNHPWSVHAITDAVKVVLGSSTSGSNSRIVFCGNDVVEQMGSLTVAIARAFSLYTQKTNQRGTNETKKLVTIPRVHVSFMIANTSGIEEKVPSDDVHLLSVCESIQLAARLVDMVRSVTLWMEVKVHVVENIFINSLITVVFGMDCNCSLRKS